MVHKTDYKDALFEERRYRMQMNADGTVTPVDETKYTQHGDRIGAKEFNAIGKSLNALEENKSNLYGFKRIFELSNIGMSLTSSVNDICNAMPNFSELYQPVSSGDVNAALKPINENGLLKITKHNEWRVILEYITNSGKLLVAAWSSGTMSEWLKCYESNLNEATGVLPITKGGTGATTAEAARNELGLGMAAIYGVANNDTTTSPWFLADARIVRQHGLEIDQVVADLAAAKTNFQAGCSAIAAAITAMGVPTASNATPTVMAGNIKSIKTMTAPGVLAGTSVMVHVEHNGWSDVQRLSTGVLYNEEGAWGRKVLTSTAGKFSINGGAARTYAKGEVVYDGGSWTNDGKLSVQHVTAHYA